jgi:hypothetical protein
MFKKIIYVTSILLICAGLRAWKCIDCPESYNYGYDYYSNRNYLPDMAGRLEKDHGIFTCIKIEKIKGEYDLNTSAYACLTAVAAQQPGKGVIVILINDIQKKGVIKISDDLKEKFPRKYIMALQDDVLNNLQGKWYLRQVTLLAKITGSFVYVLEKEKMTEKEIEEQRARMIIVDDPVYGISLIPGISDIIGLFYMEPLSFLFYYPFIMYFLIVRWFGMKFGHIGLMASNAAWLGVMAFTGILIVNRMNIYFPDYVGIFLVIAGLNIPFYAAIFALNRSEILSAASNYMSEVTGGFDAINNFEGKQWGK